MHNSCHILVQEKQVDHLHKLNKKVQTPENVPRLFDLVTVKDERLKLAFFAVLGNTVVAEDLNQVSFLSLLFLVPYFYLCFAL